jgi:hypothetical protein
MVAMSFGLQSINVVPSSGSIYYPPEAQTLFNDDFESVDFSAWNGTFTTTGDNATIISTSPYEGLYSGRFQTDIVASGTRYAYAYRSLSPVVSEVYARGYFYIAGGLPLDDNDDRFGLIAFEVGGQLQSTLRIRRSGGVDRFGIIGLNGSSSVNRDSDAVYPSEGRWYCLEFYIKVHGTIGEYRAWINGVERIAITNLDTTSYGSGVSSIRFGLTSAINVQHNVEVYCDSVVISTRYIGQLRYTFGVVGSDVDTPAIRNFYWLLGNQSISYRSLPPLEVTNFADIDRFDGLVVWTKSENGYNSSAVRQFALTHVVVSNVWDFCNTLYPSLGTEVEVVPTSTVTYVMDWGNFRNGDRVEMRNETGDVSSVMTVHASGLAVFGNVTAIARYDASRIAFFHMNGTQSGSGFYVLDLDVTTPETEWTGIWHLFPAIKMVQDFPTGKYARWMANGQSWWNLTWVYSRVDVIVSGNGDICRKWIIGHSVEGREIPAIVIGSGSRYAIIDGSIHGNEKTGTFACLRIAELLIEYYRSDPYWISRLTEYTIIVIPVLNPDGFTRNTRDNANGIDLNRQFPPDSPTTEPEAWALRNLMGNYTPTVYVNIHEGGSWYPLHMIYGEYEQGTNKSLTIIAMQQANSTFVGLQHWGWFTEQSSHVWIGKVNTIVAGGGAAGMATDYASWAYGSSCMLLETFMWSQTWGARKCFWGLDYYPAVILSFLQHVQR